MNNNSGQSNEKEKSASKFYEVISPGKVSCSQVVQIEKVMKVFLNNTDELNVKNEVFRFPNP